MKLGIATATLTVTLLASVGAGAESTQNSGFYWVPVDQGVAQFSVFELPSIRVEKRDDRTKIEYTLPRELTGAENKIVVEGPAAVEGKPLFLEGAHGYMECTGADLAHCAVKYHGLAFNDDLRKDLLTKISTTPEELSSRLKVAAFFQGGEPHGFLHVIGSQKGF